MLYPTGDVGDFPAAYDVRCDELEGELVFPLGIADSDDVFAARNLRGHERGKTDGAESEDDGGVALAGGGTSISSNSSVMPAPSEIAPFAFLTRLYYSCHDFSKWYSES